MGVNTTPWFSESAGEWLARELRDALTVTATGDIRTGVGMGKGAGTGTGTGTATGMEGPATLQGVGVEEGRLRSGIWTWTIGMVVSTDPFSKSSKRS